MRLGRERDSECGLAPRAPNELSDSSCGRSHLGRFAGQFQVAVDHLFYKSLKSVLGLPTERLTRLARVPDEVFHFGRPIKLFVLDDVIAVIKTHLGKGQLAELSH